jgi:hypothetical protein
MTTITVDTSNGDLIIEEVPSISNGKTEPVTRKLTDLLIDRGIALTLS